MAIRKAYKNLYNNIIFDSKLEVDFYKLIVDSKLFTSIKVHVPIRFPCSTTDYVVDFIVTTHKGNVHYIDTKAVWTISKLFLFKKKLLYETKRIIINIVVRDKSVDEFFDFLEYVQWVDNTGKKEIGFDVWKRAKKRGQIST